MQVLPDNAKVSKDGKECMQECVSEFISFITSEACERCLQEKRKTVNGDDIIWAMGTLGFDNYVQPMKIYLQKYRESLKSDRPEKRQRCDADDGEEDGEDMALQQFSDITDETMLSSLASAAPSVENWSLENSMR